jgi:Protein of unknown function (DUF732)
MKKTAAAVLAAAAITLSACTIQVPGDEAVVSNTPPEVTTTFETQTLDPPSPTDAVPSIEDTFISVLDERGITYPDEATAIGAAEEVCGLFDEGNGLLGVIASVESETGFSTEDAGFFTGASVAAFCPEYSSQFES